MQVRDNDTLLLYGLFQSICGWALEKGYRDISTMKSLLKLAMIDVCRQQHEDKSPSAAQMSVVADLGISLRNVQYSLKSLDELNSLATGFVKIRQIQRELLTLLSQKPQTQADLLAEISYLIHAPFELQRRALRTILKDLEQKGLICSEISDGETTYRTIEAHVSLFDPTDISARLSGLLSHLDAFKHTVGDPFFKIYYLDAVQAEGLQTALHELLLGTGNAYELECRQQNAVTQAYHFYLGCTPVAPNHLPGSVAEAMLEVIQARFQEADSPSLARTHWYHLSPSAARAVYQEIGNFIAREAETAVKSSSCHSGIPFAFYFGMADRHADMSTEGRQS